MRKSSKLFTTLIDRKLDGRSRAWLSKLTGISESKISRVVNGAAELDFSEFVSLADVLQFSSEDFRELGVHPLTNPTAFDEPEWFRPALREELKAASRRPLSEFEQAYHDANEERQALAMAILTDDIRAIEALLSSLKRASK